MSNDVRGDRAAGGEDGPRSSGVASPEASQMKRDVSHVDRSRRISPELFWVIVDAQK